MYGNMFLEKKILWTLISTQFLSEERSMSKIFISYRRDDTTANAQLIYTWLSQRMESGSVFIDIDSIDKGRDFPSVLDEAMMSSDLMLVIIGKQWLTINDEQGRRRIDAAHDFVRLEIEKALQLQKPIIPVLVDGVSMPEIADLPASITALHDKQASIVRAGQTFSSDMIALAEAIVKLVPSIWISTIETAETIRGAFRNECPIHRTNDQVQKVTAIWDYDSKVSKAPAPDTIPKDLLRIFKIFGAENVGTGCGIYFWIIIGWPIAVGFLYFIVYAYLFEDIVFRNWSFDAFDGSHASFLIFLAFQAPILVFIGYLGWIIFTIISKISKNMYKQNAEIDRENAEIEKRRHDLWDRLYYCKLDDVTYVPGETQAYKTVDDCLHQKQLDFIPHILFQLRKR
jgi:hypothetical protein